MAAWINGSHFRSPESRGLQQVLGRASLEQYGMSRFAGPHHLPAVALLYQTAAPRSRARRSIGAQLRPQCGNSRKDPRFVVRLASECGEPAA